MCSLQILQHTCGYEQECFSIVVYAAWKAQLIYISKHPISFSCHPALSLGRAKRLEELKQLEYGPLSPPLKQWVFLNIAQTYLWMK